MAKRKKKGPGRGRRGAAIDPRTGRFIRVTATTSNPSQPSPVAGPANAQSASAAIPVGPTTTPEEVTQEISGFRKALMQTMKDLSGDQSRIQDAVLEGLRKTAESIVQSNRDIFGDKFEKTIDQSAAYELFEKVVDLSEQAAKAKTVDEKRKILQRLRTFKRVARTVFSGGGKQGEIAQKLIEIIEKVEVPLAKETGVLAASKEKISDFMKQLPERVAEKIPLIGGMLGRSLRRKRESKEEEANALSALTEEISRAGRTSLYGRKGGGSGLGGSISDLGTGMAGMIDTTGEESLAGTGVMMFNKEVVVTLREILATVKDIKNLLLERWDPEDEELRNEENRREAANREKSLFARLKAFGLAGFGAGMGRGGGGGGGGGGGRSLLSSLLGGPGGLVSEEAVGAAAGSAAGAAAPGLLNSILNWLVGGGFSALFLKKIPYWLGFAVGRIVLAAKALIPVLVASLGALIGGSIAFAINKTVDKIFGTDLADRMFEAETYTLPSKLEGMPGYRPGVTEETLIQEGKGLLQQQRDLYSESYKRKMMEDPRMLPTLIQRKSITGMQALEALDRWETKYGPGPDTQKIRLKIMMLDPIGTASYQKKMNNRVIPSGMLVVPPQQFDPELRPQPNTEIKKTLYDLEKSRDDLNEIMYGPPASMASNTIVAPTTNTTNTTINNNNGNTGVRNNDPTLREAERGSM